MGLLATAQTRIGNSDCRWQSLRLAPPGSRGHLRSISDGILPAAISREVNPMNEQASPTSLPSTEGRSGNRPALSTFASVHGHAQAVVIVLPVVTSQASRLRQEGTGR
jgi:hypothetical protein